MTALLCPAKDHIGYTLSRSFISLFDYMTVDVRRGGNFRMSQALGNGQRIRTIINQQRGHRVPELVRMDRRQVIFLCKNPQPFGDVIRVHHSTVILGEHIACVYPTVTIFDFEAIIVGTV